ncbi:menaquinol oxidoreductase [Trichloromonas sp.]|uniref:menaquinol oxidoreductase n=1 Tax=Trichloromonas sp. TaxID=3069249 RepID=UPI003D816057
MELDRGDSTFLQDFIAAAGGAVSREAACRLRIEQLQVLSRKGLWGIALFAACSAAGYAAIGCQTALTAGVFTLLGAAPPVPLISLALVVYCFSALILTLPRIVDGSDRYRGWSVIAYLAAFYGFYFYARSLEVNFWAVFAVGVLLLTLEYLSLLIHCRREIRQEEAAIKRHRRWHPLG